MEANKQDSRTRRKKRPLAYEPRGLYPLVLDLPSFFLIKPGEKQENRQEWGVRTAPCSSFRCWQCQQIHPLRAEGNVEATSFVGGVIIVALSVEAPIEKGGVATPLKALRPSFADEWISDLISCLKGI